MRNALSELRAKGMIASKQGIGSTVMRRSASAAYVENYSSVDELTRFAKGTPIRTTLVEDVIADAERAAVLRGREGQAYVRIVGARFDRQDAEAPVGHVEVFVDGTYAGIRDHVRNIKVSIAETIERLYGQSIAHIEQEISVELLADDEAVMLKVAPGTPALVIRRWYASESGRIFEIAVSRYPMGRFAYRNVLMRKGEMR